MAEELYATAGAGDAGERLDAFLARVFSLTRSAGERLLAEGRVEVTDGKAEKNYRLRGGETVLVHMPDPVPAKAQPENIPLDIVFEDDDVAVINKPSGMVVHPAAGNETGTLVNALLYHCGPSLSGVGGVTRPGIVHRIDKDTSGLLVVAKNDAAHLSLSEQLKTHGVSRIYQALVLGGFRTEGGTVSARIGRHPTDRKRMAVMTKPGEGREAVTHYTVAERFAGMTLLSCRLETGRTHQIRVHMSYIGHPILGDPVYGGDGTKFGARHRALIHGQCLHAGQLTFRHPATGEQMTFHAPLPPDFEALLTILREEVQ